MTMTDPIADMLTRLRDANQAYHDSVSMPHSKLKEGGIVHQEAPIHVSNVQVVEPDSKKPARVGYRAGEDGKKVRVSRSSGKDI